MAKCFFDGNIEVFHSCTYSISDRIIVNIEYDIGCEIESEDGIRTWGDSTKFANRDIMVVDSDTNKVFLIKNAFFSGVNYKWASLDTKHTSSFSSFDWFIANSCDQLLQIKNSPTICAIRIYSKSILQYHNDHCINVEKNDENIFITMKRALSTECSSVGSNNVKEIIIGETLSGSFGTKEVSVEANGYIEIVLAQETEYMEAYKYILECMVYLQLFCPDRFSVEKVELKIEDKYFDYVTMAIRTIEIKGNDTRPSVDDSLILFLKKCYLNIPYRDVEGAVRNIPYVIMDTYRNIEDVFLMYFRFVEYFYKSHMGMRKQITIMERCLKEHNKNHLSREQIKKQAIEIVNLRNHYVHSGYYIAGSILRIRFDSEKKTPLDYNVTADFAWIREMTNIMYRMVIDIIFTQLLGYTEYRYKSV